MLMKAVYTYLKLPNVAFKIYFNTNKNPVSKKPKPKKITNQQYRTSQNHLM